MIDFVDIDLNVGHGQLGSSARVSLDPSALNGSMTNMTNMTTMNSNSFSIEITQESIDDVTGQRLVQKIEPIGIGKKRVSSTQLDAFQSIVDACNYIKFKHKKIDILINNAGFAKKEYTLIRNCMSCHITQINTMGVEWCTFILCFV